MEHPNAPPVGIATPDEVLATFTELMRSDKASERLKAAEQLAKYHSLFAQKEETPISSDTADQVEAAVAALAAERDAHG